MFARPVSLALCAWGLLTGSPVRAEEEDVAPAVEARLEFLTTAGEAIAEPRPPSDRPLRLRLSLSDALTGRPAGDRRIEAWLRAVDPANPSCEATARAFRATRALPLGATDLNGVLLAARNRDATLHVANPKLGDRAANLVAAHDPPEPPAALTADSYGLRLLAALPQRGEVAAFSVLSGESRILATGLPGVDGVEALAGGGFWVAAPGGLGLRRADGSEAVGIGISGRPRLLSIRTPDVRGYGPPLVRRLGAFSDAGELLLLDPESGAVQARFAEPPLLSAALLEGGSALSLPEPGRTVRLRYGDDPERVETLALAAPASRLTAHPEGRHAVAWTPGRAEMTAIDAATLRTRPVQAPRAGGISDLIVTEEGAAALSLDGGFVQLVDLARAIDDPDYVPATVDLGGPAPAPPDPEASTGPLLVSLSPSPQVLALDPGRSLAWLIDARLTTETPPMDAVRLRSGEPVGLHVVDRSFRRMAPGVHETTVLLRPGLQELVLTSSDPPFARCLVFEAEGETRAPILPLRADLVEGMILRAGSPGRIALRLQDGEGGNQAVDGMALLLTSLTSSDRRILKARAGADGLLRVEATFAAPGLYAVRPLRLPPGYRLDATPFLEVTTP